MKSALGTRLRIALLVVAGALAGSALTGIALAQYPAAPYYNQGGYNQYQPYMVDAIKQLRSARGYLQSASNDKGGHKQNAINLVNQAIYEVQAGINYANAHR